MALVIQALRQRRKAREHYKGVSGKMNDENQESEASGRGASYGEKKIRDRESGH